MRLLALALLLSGCSVFGDETPERTYPDVLDLPEVEIAAFQAAPVPGRYNVRGVVAFRQICSCPENVICGPCPPDGIVVADSLLPPWSSALYPQTHLYIETEQPGQFAHGAAYHVSFEATPAGEADVRLQLLGYRLVYPALGLHSQ